MNKLILFLLLFICFSAIGQENKERQISVNKVGILFSKAKQNNLLFFDKDYDYKTNAYKFQLFYSIQNNGENWDVNLILQPQFQKAQHQLLNEQFTQKKDISLYAFEVGLQLKKSVVRNISFEATLGLGAGYISLESERLAKGFTFIENLSLGLAHKINKSEFFLATTVGHVSNFNIQKPNSGYNILGFELGYRIYIK